MQQRLQATADRSAGKHIGDSRNRGRGGLLIDPSVGSMGVSFDTHTSRQARTLLSALFETSLDMSLGRRILTDRLTKGFGHETVAGAG